MNRADAKSLAETITQEQLVDMFERAKVGVKDWTIPSKVNPSISLGAAWNIYYPCLMLSMKPIKLRLVRANMLRVFGDYLAEELKPPKPQRGKAPAINIFHQEPIFEVRP